MYTETTTTGINLMNLNRKEALFIRDALALARSRPGLSSEERQMLNGLIIKLTAECEQLRPGQLPSNL